MLFSLAGLHVIKPHLTEVKRKSQLAAMNEFRRELTKRLVDISFLLFSVFSGSNHLLPEIQLSVFRFKLSAGFHSFFLKYLDVETEVKFRSDVPASVVFKLEILLKIPPSRNHASVARSRNEYFFCSSNQDHGFECLHGTEPI